MQRLTSFFGLAWSMIRSLATDDAYDKYLAHHAHPSLACASVANASACASAALRHAM